nr:PAS domain S-box protein [uncultured Desulfobulbus sp.]
MKRSPSFIVGIGASAGGHAPLEEIFTSLPTDTGQAFVVVMHLTSEGPSHLADLLRHYTDMPVVTIEEDMGVQADTAYVIPSGCFLTLKDRTFHLEAYASSSGLHHPIDHFFTSLGQEESERAIGVILSGFGNDGSQGVQRIKEYDGLVLVQDPSTAINAPMPSNAIASGVVDQILPATEIAAHLVEVSARGGNSCGPSSIPLIHKKELEQLFALLKTQTGHDFSAYKRNTILRRIDRRMVVNEIQQCQQYLTLLKQNPQEIEALYQELLIGVTGFFRDPEAFDLLRTEVIPHLVANRTEDNPIRIWHACCATGEEAYSVAMLIQEYLEENALQTKVQIFATDLDEKAINQARAGVYPASIENEVSESWLHKYFSRIDNKWQVNKQLREMIVFAHHNIIKDPPFSRLDLLVCRNFLIYLNPEMQKWLIALFHQVLHPGGYLFLGTAESVGLQSNLFAPVDKKWKIFIRQNGEQRVDLPFPFFGPIRRLPGMGTPTRSTEPQNLNPKALAEKLLMERYLPARVIVNDNNEVVHFSKEANSFLVTPEGEPTRDLLRLGREELRPALRAAIYKAFSEHKENRFQGIKVNGEGGDQFINLIVLPLVNNVPGEKLALVIFEPAPSPQVVALPQSETAAIDDGSRDAVVRHLEEQLRVTSEQLQATCEQLESSNEGFLLANEELMATNEELQSANEELQATNEELETSKEELQALNEELITLNVELHGKIEELDRTNTDLENLFTSADIATIFLDRSLHIKRFSPAMAKLFNLIPADIGRPFRHLSGIADWTELPTDAAAVLDNHPPREREVDLPDDERSFIMRVLPYRNTDNTIGGIVLTLIDISQRKKMEMALKESESTLRLFIEQAPASLAMFDRDMRYLQVSRRWLDDYGLNEEDIIVQSHYELFPAITEKWKEAHQRGMNGEILRCEADLFVRADGNKRWIRWEIRPWVDAEERIGGIVIFTEDITAIKEAEEELLRSAELRRLALDGAGLGAWEHNLVTDRITWSPLSYRLFAIEPGTEVSFEQILEKIHPEDREIFSQAVEEALHEEHQGIFRCEHRIIWPDGSEHWLLAHGQVYFEGVEAERKPVRIAGVSWEITEEKLAALQSARLASIVSSSDDAIISKNLQGIIRSWNLGAERLFGYQAQEVIGKPITLIIPEELLHEEEQIQKTLVAGGRLDHFETTRLTKNGEKVDVSLTVSPLLDDKGNIVGFSKIARDITEKIRSAKALEESEERLRLTLEATSEALWDWDVPTGTIHRSARYYTLVNRRPEEDNHDYSFFTSNIHPDDLEQVLAIIEAHKRGESEFIEYDFRLHPNNHSDRWLKVKGKAVSRDVQGAPLRIVGTLADVTHLKHQEEALLQSERHRTLALEAAMAGTWEWELASNAMLWSDEVWALYGLPPHSCHPTYEAWVNTIHPEDREQTIQALHLSVEQRAPFRLEWRSQPQDHADDRWLMAKGMPSFNKDATLEKYIGVVMDITERRENEISRRLLEGQLQQAQKMEAIGTLAGGIAHDFNNILAAIMGYTEMARDMRASRADIKKDLDKVLEAGGRAVNLVRQILAFSRQNQTERVPLEPIHVVKEAIRLLRPALPSTITIKPIHQTSSQCILADPTQIHQVVMNLCTNAFHAMEVTGGELTIRLEDCHLKPEDLALYSKVQPGNFVRLSIADTGPGIAPEIMDKIFDPYFTTKEVGRGTGLGLSIVHGIATAADGFVRCESRIGEGTVFHVYFPAVPRETQPVPAQIEVEYSGNERILLIDDEEILAEMEQGMLEQLGYQVTPQTSSLQALELFRENPGNFDAVVTDQTMPGMTGMELARKLLEIRPELPIILCTGFSTLIDEEQARKCGIRGFVMKPLAIKKLAQLLRKVLSEGKL